MKEQNRLLTIVVTDESGTRFAFADERDRQQLTDWMMFDVDPSHHKLSPDLFLEPNTESRMYGDENGDLFAVRFSRVLRMDIQFNPGESERVRKALQQHFPGLIENARKCGFRQLIFDSVHKPLIAFCKRRFGFRASPDEFKAGI